MPLFSSLRPFLMLDEGFDFSTALSLTHLHLDAPTNPLPPISPISKCIMILLTRVQEKNISHPTTELTDLSCAAKTGPKTCNTFPSKSTYI
jgi:hypothetical protein